jgi:hypothetical protein
MAEREVEKSPAKTKRKSRGPKLYIIAKTGLTDEQIVRSNAKPASTNQINYLRNLLGGSSTELACDFVSWSCGMYPGTGSLNRWDQHPPMRKVWLSSFYWRQAIDMALSGSNDYFTAEELIEISCS